MNHSTVTNNVILPVSAVVPTLDRANILWRALESLAQQGVLPSELIIIDGSREDDTRAVIDHWAASVGSGCEIVYQRANKLGAAAQRNQGLAAATQPFIWFFDDDILFEPECVARLWQAMESDKTLGGVNAMITNQRYLAPGLVSRTLFRCLNGGARISYAGKCIGPAFNILPEDDPQLPEITSVEWLNTSCTLYRRKALPDPVFPDHFVGYSLLEDLALSLQVGKTWRLANARTARIFHDSQPGEHKNDLMALARMELINRHYVMTRVLGRKSLSDYFKLGLFECFGVLTPLVSLSNWSSLPAVTLGKLKAIGAILSVSQSAES
jgi:glycosyltransferase involved in cell wall biosynthesis